MGLILDSTVLIAGERNGMDVRAVLASVRARFPGEDIAISVITVSELMHGIVRADSPRRRASRQGFLDDLITGFPIYPVTIEIAVRASQIDGENTARGARVATADLLIGATALEIGYKVLTRNFRHFRMLPGLEVIQY